MQSAAASKAIYVYGVRHLGMEKVLLGDVTLQTARLRSCVLEFSKLDFKSFKMTRTAAQSRKIDSKFLKGWSERYFVD